MSPITNDKSRLNEPGSHDSKIIVRPNQVKSHQNLQFNFNRPAPATRPLNMPKLTLNTQATTQEGLGESHT